MANLSTQATTLLENYEKDSIPNHEKKISVNPVVAELASWYEKFRTAMDYREDEVILRAAIERILKRRLILANRGQAIAAPLIRELVWARYFPDSSVPETTVEDVEKAIDLFFKLEDLINEKHKINRTKLHDWIVHILSAEIQHRLKPNEKENLMSNFIYALFKDKVTIADDTSENKDIQVFIAVRRAFAKDDLAFLRYQLFKQYFNTVSPYNLEQVATHFVEYMKMTDFQLSYPAQDKIFSYIKGEIIPFVILDDVLRENKGNLKLLAASEEDLNLQVMDACNARYKSIRGKVQRAIIRSVIFLLFTKAIFALSVEGTFERIFYGKVIISSMLINVLIPPLLMVLVGILIKTPTKDNSFKILKKTHQILYEESPNLDNALIVKKKPSKTDPILSGVFIVLWFITFILSFGAIIYILSQLSVNPISQGIFIFFLAIVSFVSYRINQTAHMYLVRTKKYSISSLLFDFFFMPFIYVGRRLTTAISSINIILFIFDFIIEMPFKAIVAFFEQWLFFLRNQREKLY